MKKLMVAAAAGAMAFGAYADSSRSITVTAYNRGTDGVVESVDLAFGECADDYVGDLYVAYGYTAGDDLTPTNGWDHYEKLSDAITAEVTSYHYAMPEGWSESIYNLKFFLFVQNKGYETVKDYYVQSGLVKMFDGIDNAGTGAHDATATQWKNLVDGEMYDWIGTMSWQDGNALEIGDSMSSFPFAPEGLGRIWTLEIVMTKVSGTFLDCKSDNLWSNGGAVKFQWRSGTRPSLTGWTKKETLTIVSGETWYGVRFDSCAGEDHWNKVADTIAADKTLSEPVCLGGGESLKAKYGEGNDGSGTGTKVACIRVYDRALTGAEVAANDIVDQARFYGRGTVPPLGESAYVLSGTSDLIKRDAYGALSLDQIDEPTEIDISARLTLGGFDLGARAFAIYAVFGDGTEQQVATDVKLGDSVGVKVEGLVPDAAYAVRFYAKDATFSTPMTQEKTFVTPKPVLHPAKALEGGRAINIAGYKTKKGFITGVDLAFGACPDDWTGDLYVAYGQRSGNDMSDEGWSQYEKVREEPFTASDQTFHFDMPEGWRETIWTVRFVFEVRTTKFLNASSYYVPDGLIAMWDGIDNAGVGTNVIGATIWKDLVGYNDITFNDRLFFMTNAIACTAYQRKAGVPDAVAKYKLDVSTNLTYEIFYKQNGGSCVAAIQNAFGSLYIWNGSDWTQFADKTANVTRMPYPGYDTMVHNSVAVGGYNNITAYLNGEDKGYYADDAWYAGPKPSIFSEDNSNNNTRGATGEIYVFRIYNRKLTADEVAQNYNVDCIRYKGAEGELVNRTDRYVAASSSETIYAGKRMSGMMVIIW